MANFKDAFTKIIGYEGGYVDDPDDRGRETYKGISRRWYPDWEGWEIIDSAKRKNSFPDNLASNGELQNLVRSFYQVEYWKKFWGGAIPSQGIAEELFDSAVNMGLSDAVKFLQKGLNVLNRRGKLYDDIVIDGRFGKKTLRALMAYLAEDSAKFLLNVMNVLQGAHYIDNAMVDESQEKFLRGWLKRVEIIK